MEICLAMFGFWIWIIPPIDFIIVPFSTGIYDWERMPMSRQQGLDEANKYFDIVTYVATSLRKNKHLLSFQLKL